jgi:hypothetical protein
VLWRRSKLGLLITPTQAAAVDNYLARMPAAVS